MSHRRKEKQETKNKNQEINKKIIREYIQDLNNEIDILRHRIKKIKKMRDAIEWNLI